jgi:Protein of unknown function (DUF2971)
MWAHYSSKHTGVCLEFDRNSLPFDQAVKVIYCATYPAIDVTEEHSTQDENIFSSKSKAWEYENEYRLISGEASTPPPNLPIITNNGIFQLPEGALKSVIVGCLATESTIDAVKKMIADSGYPIQLKYAKRLDNEYKLEIRDSK